MDQSARTPRQLGAELRRYRKNRKLTQAQLSSRIDKRQATISTLEAAGNGTLDTLFAVLSALDLELSLRPRTKGSRTDLEAIF
jgi:HTH-type transcriptional regulator / antitoxin HipB